MFGAAMLYHVTRVTRLHNIWECLLDLKFCARMATTGKELHKHHLALNWWRGIEFLCVYRAPQCCLVHARIWLFPNFSSSFSRPPCPFSFRSTLRVFRSKRLQFSVLIYGEFMRVILDSEWFLFFPAENEQIIIFEVWCTLTANNVTIVRLRT